MSAFRELLFSRNACFAIVLETPMKLHIKFLSQNFQTLSLKTSKKLSKEIKKGH